MSKSALSKIVILLLVLVAALVLNPSGERHRSAIRAAIAERSPIAGALGIGALTSLVSEYRSLGVVSYTLMDDHVISVGAFGLVHVIQRSPDK